MRKFLLILNLTTLPLFASIDIKSDEGFLEKGVSTFSGNVSINCSDKLSIICETLTQDKLGYKLSKSTIENDTFSISSKMSLFDHRLERGEFNEDVVFKNNDLTIYASAAECLLENYQPHQVTLYSLKKDGCRLKADFLKDMTFQRVNVDILEKQALFFFSKGELLKKDKTIVFSANVMKVEPAKVVLDGKIQIQIGHAIYKGDGPVVIQFDDKDLTIDKCYGEGKSTLAWNEYLFDLDGSFRYDSKIHKIFFKTPQTSGLNFKYPLGEVMATIGEITLNTDNLTVEEVILSQDVFATYGIPTVQFLLADSICIKPLDHLATLYSNDKSKVLLYDQVNKLEMSSNQVNIEWGNKLGEERIEGMGDVRFSFDQREKSIIDALFKH